MSHQTQTNNLQGSGEQSNAGLSSAIEFAIELLTAVLNSNLLAIAISTLVAAFFGALGAQWIAERTRKKNRVLNELRSANSTILIAHNIANTCLIMKRDNLKPLKENYISERERCLAFMDSIRLGIHKAGSVFHFVADMRFLPKVDTPIDRLENQVFDKLRAQGRILSATMTLSRNLQSLNGSIEERNHLIKHYQTASLSPGKQAEFYFGIKTPGGVEDKRYFDTMEAIYYYNDSCIFLANLICEDVHRLGIQIRDEYGDKNIIVNDAKFDKAEELDLMPDKSRYEDWLSMFQIP